MVANVTQIKSKTWINVDVSGEIKQKMCAEIVIFGILLHAVVKMLDMEKALLIAQWLRVMKL